MNFFKEQQIRILLYSILIIILTIGSFFVYLLWKDAKEFNIVDSTVATAKSNRPYDGLKIDTTVLDSIKFKELTPIQVSNVPAATSTIGTTTPATGSTSSAALTQEQLRQIPRRNGNPFSPF
ncbi:hypothetical protein COT94_01770 [Candidatus Falkowbacteria bacterium CG10_big_fil_rev_8_21_14_0_10_37_14]|uniref:Uncharacterized protein n=1 Tax=Candidatus Falkowbacteria bacterium CG10_big_fil_rev_8_21_14_0_10_37_14 TaxID=1974561 RepID=A0A2M6WTQ1_9BACT|nr:hypothetical protein [Candidatus Falkowbacteria bacterium]PIT96174.1 MAG: hypothetical protein COT94_01770 [Candidatus Falkowbacteria bacterium CG10_big_fil_rev_8_21_14_0_10_37_14]